VPAKSQVYYNSIPWELHKNPKGEYYPHYISEEITTQKGAATVSVTQQMRDGIWDLNPALTRVLSDIHLEDILKLSSPQELPQEALAITIYVF
jgi:hypothetical protein